ncbi:hypothetical protein BH11PAT2_BH11PAT2_09090 [soil metagenome]
MSKANNRLKVHIDLRPLFVLVLASFALILPGNVYATNITCFNQRGLITCNDGFANTSTQPPSSINTQGIVNKDQQAETLYNALRAQYGSSAFATCYQKGKCSAQSGSSNLICAHWVESCLITAQQNQQAQQAQLQYIQSEMNAARSETLVKEKAAPETPVVSAPAPAPVEAVPTVVPTVRTSSVAPSAPVSNAPIVGGLPKNSGMPVLNNGTNAPTPIPTPAIETKSVSQPSGFWSELFHLARMLFWF